MDTHHHGPKTGGTPEKSINQAEPEKEQDWMGAGTGGGRGYFIHVNGDRYGDEPAEHAPSTLLEEREHPQSVSVSLQKY